MWVGTATRPVVVADRRAVQCNAFGDFVQYYISIPDSDQLHTNVSLSAADVFGNGTMTPTEYVTCYTNFIKLIGQRFTSNSKRVDVSVRVGSDLLSPAQVSMLQGTEIVGIAPMQIVYGEDAVRESYAERQKYHATWPGYLINRSTSTAESTTVTLTAQQQVIFDLIRNRGASNKQIARYMNLSESTVKFHMGAILKKYHLRNRTQLAVLTTAGRLCY